MTSSSSLDAVLEFEIKNRRGLHARAAAKIVKIVSDFKSDVHIHHGTKDVMATSIMGLLFLGVGQGDKIRITAHGPDAHDVLKALEELIDEKFSEDV